MLDTMQEDCGAAQRTLFKLLAKIGKSPWQPAIIDLSRGRKDCCSYLGQLLTQLQGMYVPLLGLMRAGCCRVRRCSAARGTAIASVCTTVVFVLFVIVVVVVKL
jgi:hypothetical protein